MMTLREFKAKQLARLSRLEQELKTKYPEKKERVSQITTMLETKLMNLRIYTLADYLFSIVFASKEFYEFISLMPTEKEIDELLSSNDD